MSMAISNRDGYEFGSGIGGEAKSFELSRGGVCKVVLKQVRTRPSLVQEASMSWCLKRVGKCSAKALKYSARL